MFIEKHKIDGFSNMLYLYIISVDKVDAPRFLILFKKPSYKYGQNLIVLLFEYIPRGINS